jgi:MscS family membrane protein
MVTLPNSVLVNTTVNNYGMRSYRRWSTKMDLLYETSPEQVDAYCEGVRELVRNHPFMRRENYQVYLNEFGESGIQILIYVFWQVPDWSTELRERHRFMLDLMRLAKSLGVSFAYPTQTLYLARSPAISKTPDSLVSGQEQDVNEKSGRAAARLLIEGADWLSRKPEPHIYLDAERSKSLDEGRADATPDLADAPKTRGDAGGGGEGA